MPYSTKTHKNRHLIRRPFDETVTHPIPPLFDASSRILILGSFPSVKSRRACFFIIIPRTVSKVLAGVLEEPVPGSIEEKKIFLLKHRIALWDVIASCTIEGSSDSTIKNVVPNDLSGILSAADISRIFCNGGASFQYYKKYQEPRTGRSRPPSLHQPGQRRLVLKRLIREWAVIRDSLHV